jgi:phosphoglycerate dehydrogenase-like enzyme
MPPVYEGRAHVPMQGQVEVTLQVMSLLQEVVQVKALLKVADVISLLSPLTRTQTTMPQTRLAARTSR